MTFEEWFEANKPAGRTIEELPSYITNALRAAYNAGRDEGIKSASATFIKKLEVFQMELIDDFWWD